MVNVSKVNNATILVIENPSEEEQRLLDKFIKDCNNQKPKSNCSKFFSANKEFMETKNTYNASQESKKPWKNPFNDSYTDVPF